MKMYLRFIPFLLVICIQQAANAQSAQAYQKTKNAADSLAQIDEFASSEAMYLKALKIFDQDPLLHINLASMYLKMQKTDDAENFMKSAIVKGADMDMLLRDPRIKIYLAADQEVGAKYSSLIKKHESLIQLTDKTRWIDDYRVYFNDNGKSLPIRRH